MLGPVITWMGSRLRAGKPSRYVMYSEVDLAFYPPQWISAFGLSNNNKWWWFTGYWFMVYWLPIVGPVAQDGWFSPKVSDSPVTWRRAVFIAWTEWTLAMPLPWWQHYEQCPGYYYNDYYAKRLRWLKDTSAKVMVGALVSICRRF